MAKRDMDRELNTDQRSCLDRRNATHTCSKNFLGTNDFKNYGTFYVVEDLDFSWQNSAQSERICVVSNIENVTDIDSKAGNNVHLPYLPKCVGIVRSNKERVHVTTNRTVSVRRGHSRYADLCHRTNFHQRNSSATDYTFVIENYFDHDSVDHLNFMFCIFDIREYTRYELTTGTAVDSFGKDA